MSGGRITLCAKPGCGEKATNREEVRPWFTGLINKDHRPPRTYLVCDLHDAEYFPRSFNRDASDRVRIELRSEEAPQEFIIDGRRLFDINGQSFKVATEEKARRLQYAINQSMSAAVKAANTQPPENGGEE